MNKDIRVAIQDALGDDEPVTDGYLSLYDDYLTLLWEITGHGPEDFESVFDDAVKILCRLLPKAEGGADELISPKGIATSKKAYERFHAEGDTDE